MKAEFREKSFENAFNVELGSSVFSTDQVAEKLLGYDAFGNPSRTHKIWAILGTRPPGVILTNGHWIHTPSPGAALPPIKRATSLLLQYKRPEYLHLSTSKQWHLWNSPYYRFRIETQQQAVLSGLESTLRGDALVRYASPCFHTWNELIDHAVADEIIEQTGFTTPHSLGTHSYWTYQFPGTVGKPNPKNVGDEAVVETFESLLESLSEIAHETLVEHLRSIHILGQTFLREFHQDYALQRPDEAADNNREDSTALAAPSLRELQQTLSACADAIRDEFVEVEENQLDAFLGLMTASRIAEFFNLDWKLALQD